MVADASAILAFFRQEPGAEVVRDALIRGGVRLCAVNRTEIEGKIVGENLLEPTAAAAALATLDRTVTVEPFDAIQARLAAYWYARRRPYKLSLGDCASLAFAELTGEPILTAERAWRGLPGLRVEVRTIR